MVLVETYIKQVFRERFCQEDENPLKFDQAVLFVARSRLNAFVFVNTANKNFDCQTSDYCA